MLSRVVGKDRAARTVLVLAGKRSDSSNVKCKLTNTPMKKELYIGLDVHKDSITVAVAQGGRDGEVRLYGTISNDLHAGATHLENAICPPRSGAAPGSASGLSQVVFV